MLKHDNKLSQKAFLKVDEDVFDLVPAGFCMSARVTQWSNLIGWRRPHQYEETIRGPAKAGLIFIVKLWIVS